MYWRNGSAMLGGLLCLLLAACRNFEHPGNAQVQPLDRIPRSTEGSPSLPGDISGVPLGTLVPIHTEADKAVYELGEPIHLRMEFVNREPSMVRVRIGERSKEHYSGLVIRSKSKYSYRYFGFKKEERLVRPGEKITLETEFEFHKIGEIEIKGRPQTFMKSEVLSFFTVLVEIVDKGRKEILEEKAKRLAARLLKEIGFGPRLPSWNVVQNELMKLGRASIPQLLRILKRSDNPRARAAAAKILGHMTPGYIRCEEPVTLHVPDLIKGLSDNDWRVRAKCVESLGRLKDPRALEAILLSFKDPNEEVRQYAVSAAWYFDDPKVVEPLKRALVDDGPLVRYFAACGLAERDDPSGVAVLIGELREDSWFNCREIVPLLEKVTVLSFGQLPDWRQGDKSLGEFEEYERRCDEVARKWLDWLEKEGKARYGGD